MFGLDIVTTATLLTLAAAQPQPAAPSPARNLCSDIKTAKINVVPKTMNIVYDYSQPLAAIQSGRMDTINPYGFHTMTVTQGFMQGMIKLTPSVKVLYKEIPQYGAACLWYDTIDITIEIDPKIVIAKEVYNDPCMGKAVIAHEMKHINADRRIVNKYAKSMGKKVYDALAERGFQASPVDIRNAKPMAERMQKFIFQTLELEYRKMDIERTETQQAIDSLNEYQRISAQCPDFNPLALKPQKKRRP